MAGGAAAEHAAEGIIAKAAKAVLRDARGPAGRAAEHSPAARAAKNVEHELATGGRVRPSDIGVWDEWADEGYAQIRADSGDVDSIVAHLSSTALADGSALTRDDIAAIKRHLFEAVHPIVDHEGALTARPFDADPEIVEAWSRLRAGEGNANDRLLLQHEMAEVSYLRAHPSSTYNEAHAYANSHANWQKSIEGG